MANNSGNRGSAVKKARPNPPKESVGAVYFINPAGMIGWHIPLAISSVREMKVSQAVVQLRPKLRRRFALRAFATK